MLDDEPTSTTPSTAASTDAPVRRPRRRAASRPAGPPPHEPAPSTAPASAEPAAPAADTAAAPAPAPAKKAAAKRTTKKRVSSATADAAVATPGVDETAPLAAPPAAAERPKRKRAAKKAAGAPDSSAPIESTSAAPADSAAQDAGSTARRGQFSAPERQLANESSGAGGSAVPLLFQAADSGSGEPTPPAKAGVESTEVRSTGGADDQRSDGDEEGGTPRRRRSRGGRNRRKSAADAEKTDTSDSADTAADSAGTSADAPDSAKDDDTSDDDEGSASTRRRRRRRRSGEDSADTPDDPADTVVRVRTPRAKKDTKKDTKKDAITSVEGSTRIEAKKQRRRDGRDAGRRRPPILSESEFLARRESVERVMAIRQRGETTQIAVLEDNVLVEHYVALESENSIIGNVYVGRVQNVLPSMEAAFIDIGKGRNAVLYAGEVNWALMGVGNQARRIENALKPGQAILVQVSKDPVGHKGARLTSQISLPGRYLVYVPGGGTNGISRKLPDTERNRLKNILKDILPDDAGVIIRTAAEGASEEELTRDVTRLTALWDDIEKKLKKGQAPQALYAEPDTTLKVVRDLFTEDFAKLVISGDDAWDMVDGYVQHVAPDLAERLERYEGEGDILADFRIDEQIAKALERKVWLPSGGSLVIDRTEAMTVVDVNTGKFTGSGGNLEETVTKNNLEAAEEIVRQLRLRDIGGIIVVDFIDMVLENNRDLVLRRLVECLGRDRTRHQVAEVTSLGLVQMTRKRISIGLLEAFSHNCEQCQGRGVVIEMEPVEPRKGDSGHSGGSNGRPESSSSSRSGSKRSSSRRRGGQRSGGDDDGDTEGGSDAGVSDSSD